MSTHAMLHIQLLKSPIAILPVHKMCLKGLGLKKIRQIVLRQDTPEIRGLINKVSHMLRVEE